ncbi:MAG: hypothetical protein P9M05_00040 [Candidatus Stygibacter australis]|nr:hypothetical protein [Candidatus Stygibacter australis]
MSNNSYDIGGLPICITGNDTPVKRELMGMLRLNQISENKQKIMFRIHEIKEIEEIEGFIPDWVYIKMQNDLNSQCLEVLYNSKEKKDFGIFWLDQSIRFCVYFDYELVEINLIVVRSNESIKTGLNLSTLICPLLSELFAQQSKILIHSASLRLPNGKGILISADGKGGKTTTALSLVRQGAKLTGDDLAVISFISKGKLNFRGIPEFVNIREKTISFFPELKNVPKLVTKLDNGNYPISPLEIYPDCIFYKELSLDILYFLNLTTGKPTLRKLEFIDAYQRLSRSRFLVKNQHLPPQLSKAFFHAIDKIKIFELNTGDDPLYLGKWLINHAETQ